MNNIKQKMKFLKNPFIIIAITVVLAFASFIIYEAGFSLEVKLNGEVVGYVKNNDVVEEAVELVQNDVLHAYGEDAFFEQEILTDKVRGYKDDEVEADGLNKFINEEIEVYKPASVIVVDKKDAVAVRTERVAFEVLEEIKMPYQETKDGSEVLDVYFDQEVEVITKDVLVDNILTYDLALLPFVDNKSNTKNLKLANGDVVYAVTPLSKLSTDNHEVINLDKDKSDKKQSSQIELDVVSVSEEKELETIDYETTKVKDDTLFVKTTKIKDAGENGEKEITTKITYINGKEDKREKTKEKVLTKPTDKVVAVGTKKRPVVVAKKVSNAAPAVASASHVSGSAGQIVNEAYSHVGRAPYLAGGASPSGFDCSGFTSYVYGRAGLHIPRSSSGQANWGSQVSRGNLQAGDLVIFRGMTGGGVGHTGIYIGNGQMIHASVPGTKINIESINSGYFSSRYVTARRAP